jgi:hypothetical protein
MTHTFFFFFTAICLRLPLKHCKISIPNAVQLSSPCQGVIKVFPVTFEVLMAGIMTRVFYNMTRYRFTDCYRKFGGQNKSSWIVQKMKDGSSYKTLVIMYRCTKYRIPDVLNLQCHLSSSSKPESGLVTQ